MEHSIFVDDNELCFSPLQPKERLQKAHTRAKEHERLLVWNSYRKTFVRIMASLGSSWNIDTFAVPVAFATAVEKKIERLNKKVAFFSLRSVDETLTRECTRLGYQQKRKEIVKLLRKHDYIVPEELAVAFIEDHSTPSFTQTDYRHFARCILALISTLENSKKSCQKKNQTLLKALRKCITHPIYHFLKEDETHPAITLLHSLCLASLAEPHLLESFLPLAEQIGSCTSQEISENLTFCELLKASRHSAYIHGLMKNDRNLQYALRHGKYLFGALLSMSFGRWFSWIKKYDPRGDLENNPGAFFEQTFVTASHTQCSARTVYTPSPTIGETVAPEMRAALQAMENRALQSNESLKKEYLPYIFLVYTNLQNLQSPHERKRSLALMQLQRQYPLSCFVSTVSQDSPFYKDGVGGRNEKKIAQNIAKNTSALDNAYKEALVQEIVNDDNFVFSYEPIHARSHYSFPIRTMGEKMLYVKCFIDIVEEAYSLVATKHTDNNWYAKAAFRELVFLGIIAFQQALSIQRIQQTHSSFSVLFTNACKENIDRGGKTNAELFWALGNRTKDSLKQVLAAIHSRALLTRARLIHPHRIEAMYALTLLLSQDEVATFLENQYAKKSLSMPHIQSLGLS